MKNKNGLLIIIGIFIIILVAIGIKFYLFNKKSYSLKLPDIEKVVSISLEKNGSGILLSGEKEIEDIFYVVKGEERVTTESSVNEVPKDSNDVIKIDFNYESRIATVVYVYLKNNEYYLEQPLNGIYSITEDNYNQIASYFE